MLRNLVRLIAKFVVWIAPYVWRFARMLFFLTITAISSIYLGVPTAVNRIADNWIEEATAAGLPIGYHRWLRIGARVVASITLFLGWMALASLTVFILRLIFHF